MLLRKQQDRRDDWKEQKPLVFRPGAQRAGQPRQDQRAGRAVRGASVTLEKDEGGQDEKGERDVGELGASHQEEQRGAQQDHRAQIALRPAPQMGQRGQQQADGEQREQKREDGRDVNAFAAHIPPGADDRQRQQQRVVPVGPPVHPAGKDVSPRLSGPVQEAGVHVPDQPCVPFAVGRFPPGEQERGQEGEHLDGEDSRQHHFQGGPLGRLRNRL